MLALKSTMWTIPLATVGAAALTAAQLWAVPAMLPAELLAKTVLAMGGNGNTTGLLMQNELAGYIDPANENYGLCGTVGGCTDDTFGTVTWNASVWAPLSDFDRQQADGVASLDAQLRQALANERADSTDPEVHVVVVGYSSSGNVVIKEMAALQAQRDANDPDALTPDEVSFLVMGSPNRPNGGIFPRFPGAFVPIAGVTLGDSNPDTDYQLTDVSWKYDLISDAPAYANPLSLANASVGFFYQHSFYFEADPNGQRVEEVVDPNTGYRYITIEARRLALLQPFYDLSPWDRPIYAVEPALKVLVDLGYDRETPVYEPTPAKLLPPPERLVQAVPALRDAIDEGAKIMLGQKDPDPDGEDARSGNATWNVISTIVGDTLKSVDIGTGTGIGETSSKTRSLAFGKSATARKSPAINSVADSDRPVRQSLSRAATDIRKGVRDTVDKVRDRVKNRTAKTAVAVD